MSRAIYRRMPSPSILRVPREAAAFAALGTGTAGGWPATNRAIIMPWSSDITCRIASLSLYIATIPAAGSWDIGIYDSTGTTLLASNGGTTSAVGLATWTLTTPFLVEAGKRYYIGVAMNNASDTFARATPSILALRSAGYAQMASAYPLPATFTPAQIGAALIPIVSATFL